MKTYTLELTEPERDMLRDFFACYFAQYEDDTIEHQTKNADSKVAMSLYTKVDNLDPEEVEAS